MRPFEKASAASHPLPAWAGHRSYRRQQALCCRAPAWLRAPKLTKKSAKMKEWRERGACRILACFVASVMCETSHWKLFIARARLWCGLWCGLWCDRLTMQVKIIKHKHLRASQAYIGWEGSSNGDLRGIMLGGDMANVIMEDPKVFF